MWIVLFIIHALSMESQEKMKGGNQLRAYFISHCCVVEYCLLYHWLLRLVLQCSTVILPILFSKIAFTSKKRFCSFLCIHCTFKTSLSLVTLMIPVSCFPLNL